MARVSQAGTSVEFDGRATPASAAATLTFEPALLAGARFVAGATYAVTVSSDIPADAVLFGMLGSSGGTWAVGNCGQGDQTGIYTSGAAGNWIAPAGVGTVVVIGGSVSDSLVLDSTASMTITGDTAPPTPAPVLAPPTTPTAPAPTASPVFAVLTNAPTDSPNDAPTVSPTADSSWFASCFTGGDGTTGFETSASGMCYPAYDCAIPGSGCVRVGDNFRSPEITCNNAVVAYAMHSNADTQSPTALPTTILPTLSGATQPPSTSPAASTDSLTGIPAEIAYGPSMTWAGGLSAHAGAGTLTLTFDPAVTGATFEAGKPYTVTLTYTGGSSGGYGAIGAGAGGAVSGVAADMRCDRSGQSAINATVATWTAPAVQAQAVVAGMWGVDGNNTIATVLVRLTRTTATPTTEPTQVPTASAPSASPIGSASPATTEPTISPTVTVSPSGSPTSPPTPAPVSFADFITRSPVTTAPVTVAPVAPVTAVPVMSPTSAPTALQRFVSSMVTTFDGDIGDVADKQSFLDAAQAGLTAYGTWISDSDIASKTASAGSIVVTFVFVNGAVTETEARLIINATDPLTGTPITVTVGGVVYTQSSISVMGAAYYAHASGSPRGEADFSPTKAVLIYFMVLVVTMALSETVLHMYQDALGKQQFSQVSINDYRSGSTVRTTESVRRYRGSINKLITETMGNDSIASQMIDHPILPAALPTLIRHLTVTEQDHSTYSGGGGTPVNTAAETDVDAAYAGGGSSQA